MINPLSLAPTELEAFLASIVENLPHMIFVKDANELRFVRFNKAGEELLGFPREELIGKNDYDFFPKKEADFFTQKDREVLAGKKVMDIPEELIHTRFKGVRILHTKKIPILDEHGSPQYLLGISEDITDKKHIEKELNAKTDQLTRANAERDQSESFAYIASHDLKEPLQKIVGFSDLLTHYKSIDEKAKDYAGRIEAAAQRLNRMINDVLKFSAVTVKKQPFEPVCLNQTLKQVLLDLELRITELKARVDMGDLPVLNADEVQMYHLFQNLITNALKFRLKGTLPHIVIQSEGFADGFLWVSVKDNGIGFQEEKASVLFEPFERLHDQPLCEGSGLGLAICKKIIERHGGRIEAHGRPNQGAEFHLFFPKSLVLQESAASHG